MINTHVHSMVMACVRAQSSSQSLTRVGHRPARFGLIFEFPSNPWLCAHQQATEKVNPATVQRRSAAVADVFTATFTPISSARAVNVSW